jgi:hypothetical protein
MDPITAICAWHGCTETPARILLTDIGMYPKLQIHACEDHAEQLHQWGWQIMLIPAAAIPSATSSEVAELDALYTETGQVLRRIVRDVWGDDFTHPELGGSLAVCADMDAAALAAWLAENIGELTDEVSDQKEECPVCVEWAGCAPADHRHDEEAEVR